MVATTLKYDFGYDTRSVSEKRVSIFDPCAGEGLFLHRIVHHAKKASKATEVKGVTVGSYAVELDSERYEKIRGTDQKIKGSFFETTNNGGRFSIILLNPPYNRNGGELVSWVEKAAPMVAHGGVMALIIPKYELKGEMIETLRGNFSFCYAFLSREHAAFNQVVVLLTNTLHNKADPTYPHTYRNMQHRDNLEDLPEDPIMAYANDPLTIEITIRPGKRPLLESKDLSGFYEECEERLDKETGFMLDKEYPSSYDTSIQPVSTLRTAHAIQLAAMNSQIESITINGVFYLAKYMVISKKETYESYDDGVTTETTVYKPTVETFLMDQNGIVKTGRELGFDYVELNSALSTILLQKLTKMYKPLHEIGQDEEFLKDELKEIGLLAPQREAVKAIVKAFNSGRKGIGVRASTGTGKTWIAKAVKYIIGAKRSIMVTEPHLVPQMVQEYKDEGFDVHVIDSWEKLRELSKTRPKGLYLISYTRLRMHPDFEIITTTRKVWTKEGPKYTTACVHCYSEIENLRKGDKKHCPGCGEVLYTYVPENTRQPMSYKRWIADIERNGTSVEVKSHNKQLPYIRFLKRMRFDLAIIDEAHNAANLMSNQGSAFIRLAASASRVLALTATVTNGMAKSLYNLLWGINPVQMKEKKWDRKSSTNFQAMYGAFKEVRKTDDRNRHRESEKVHTYDTAGISPAALIYTLPNFVNVDSEDFDDLPPVEREVIKCKPHPEVEDCIRTIKKIIDDANLPFEDMMSAASVRTAAVLRVSDTFKHADDEICLRGLRLGTLKMRDVPELLEKEEELVEIIKGVAARKERALVFTDNTQKIDMRGPLKRIITAEVPYVTIAVLVDSVKVGNVVEWFQKSTEQIVIAPMRRVATGQNLSQFNNMILYDYTSNTRLAEQIEGRPRRVNTAGIHRAIFGEVRPVRYWYLTSSEVQEAQLAYTLEKRMIAKLAEGETPDIDPAECTSGNQSFSALVTRALREGNFDYQDPSVLLKKMTKADNAQVRKENLIIPGIEPIASNVIYLPQPELLIPVIFIEDGREMVVEMPKHRVSELFEQGLIDLTLFGNYYREPKTVRRNKAA
jgi:superfamily II DNA or RNA helicase